MTSRRHVWNKELAFLHFWDLVLMPVMCFEREKRSRTQTLQRCHRLASRAAGPSPGFPRTAGWPHTSGWGQSLWTGDWSSRFMSHENHPRWVPVLRFLLYLRDIKLLQTIQERSENGRHLRLQSMTCDTRPESERSLRNRVFSKHICHCLRLHPSVLYEGKGAVFIWRLQTKGGNINVTLE